jgi:WD domain, G-beta repeat
MAKLTQPPILKQRWQASMGDHVIALAWSSHGSTLAAASVAGPITLFDTASGAVQHTLPGHGFGTAALAWQPGGKLLASAGQDGKVRFWDSQTGSEAAVVEGGSAWVEQLAWHPGGAQLLSAAGKKLRLWDSRGELIRNYPDQDATIAAVAWLPKGKEFVSACYGGVSFWSPENESLKRRMEWKGSILALAVSPDGQYIAGGGQDASVHFWYVKNGKDLAMTGYPRKVQEISWDTGSQFLATGGGNLVTIWDCSGKGPAGSKPLSYELHVNPVSSLSFQNKGALLASACGDGIIALWYPGVWKKALAVTQFSEGVARLSWKPGDDRFAVGGAAGAVAVYAL